MTAEKINENRLDINKCSPSNINTDRQKHYGKLEYDGKLDLFIEIFKKNGNKWEIDRATFEHAIDKKGIDREKLVGYSYVYQDALEEAGDKIKIRIPIIEALLEHNYQISPRNIVRNVKKKICELLS